MFLFVIIKVVLLYKSLLINSHRVITIEKKNKQKKQRAVLLCCGVCFVDILETDYDIGRIQN